MTQALELLHWRKSMFQYKVTLNSEEVKPVAIQVMLVCHSVENYVNFKFFFKVLVEGLMVNLKTDVTKQIIL